MRYYVGDVVEIVTAPYKSMQDIPEWDYMFETRQGSKLAPFIGLRFIVEYVNPENTVVNNKEINGYPSVDNIILYKRPFKNWIKYATQSFSSKRLR